MFIVLQILCLLHEVKAVLAFLDLLFSNTTYFFAALGCTPSHLEEIINADVGFGRYQRQVSAPRRRFSRSPSPSFHLGSSRGATPDFAKVQRMASPDAGKVRGRRNIHKWK